MPRSTDALLTTLIAFLAACASPVRASPPGVASDDGTARRRADIELLLNCAPLEETSSLPDECRYYAAFGPVSQRTKILVDSSINAFSRRAAVGMAVADSARLLHESCLLSEFFTRDESLRWRVYRLGPPGMPALFHIVRSLWNDKAAAPSYLILKSTVFVCWSDRAPVVDGVERESADILIPRDSVSPYSDIRFPVKRLRETSYRPAEEMQFDEIPIGRIRTPEVQKALEMVSGLPAGDSSGHTDLGENVKIRPQEISLGDAHLALERIGVKDVYRGEGRTRVVFESWGLVPSGGDSGIIMFDQPPETCAGTVFELSPRPGHRIYVSPVELPGGWRQYSYIDF